MPRFESRVHYHAPHGNPSGLATDTRVIVVEDAAASMRNSRLPVLDELRVLGVDLH